MAKWSIRLVACYFCLWAITDVYQLLKGTRQEKGFMVFDLGLTVNGKYVDAIAWIGVCILLHTGVQLLRFDSRGRSWALFILWFHSIASVLFFLAFLASLLPGDFVSYTIEPTIPAGLAFSIIFAFFPDPFIYSSTQRHKNGISKTGNIRTQTGCRVRTRRYNCGGV